MRFDLSIFSFLTLGTGPSSGKSDGVVDSSAGSSASFGSLLDSLTHPSIPTGAVADLPAPEIPTRGDSHDAAEPDSNFPVPVRGDGVNSGILPLESPIHLSSEALSAALNATTIPGTKTAPPSGDVAGLSPNDDRVPYPSSENPLTTRPPGFGVAAANVSASPKSTTVLPEITTAAPIGAKETPAGRPQLVPVVEIAARPPAAPPDLPFVHAESSRVSHRETVRPVPGFPAIAPATGTGQPTTAPFAARPLGETVPESVPPPVDAGLEADRKPVIARPPSTPVQTEVTPRPPVEPAVTAAMPVRETPPARPTSLLDTVARVEVSRGAPASPISTVEKPPVLPETFEVTRPNGGVSARAEQAASHHPPSGTARLIDPAAVEIAAAPLAAIEGRPQRRREQGSIATPRGAEKIFATSGPFESRSVPGTPFAGERPEVQVVRTPLVEQGKARRIATELPHTEMAPRFDVEGPVRKQTVEPFAAAEQTVREASRATERPARETPAPVPETTNSTVDPAAPRPLVNTPRILGPGAPMRTEWIAQAVVAQARDLPPNAPVELRFALHPEELGEVRIRILVSGERLQVELVANNTGATGTLNAGVPRLIQQLEAAGFPDVEVRLALDSHGDPGTQQRQGEKNATRDSSHARPQPDRPSWDADRSPERRGRHAHSRLDRMA